MYPQAFGKSTTKFIAASLIVMLGLAIFPVRPALADIVVTLTSSGNWTVPAGVFSITVECWGGGGGGSTRTSNGGGGGGGGGAYAKVDNYAVTQGANIPYVIGTGGSAGGNGGNTSFDSTACIAEGGKGVASNSTIGGAGGLATNSTGDTKFDGGIGYSYSTGTYGAGGGGSAGTGSGGNNTVATDATSNSGAVAVTGGGPGGNGASGQNNGSTPGSAPGGGGGGAYRSSSGTRTGGSGYRGQIIITYVGLPTLTSPTAGSITSSSATLGANVTSNGGTTLTERGTCWGTSAAPTTNCLAEGGTGTGIFTQARTGITTDSQIYYRGFATNTVGTAYSTDGSFFTEPSVQASGVNFSLVSSTSMNINWVRGTGGDGVIVLMKAGSAIAGVPADGMFTTYTANTVFGSGTLITDGFVVYKGSGTSVAATNLTAGSTYYISVFEYKGSVNTSGTAQGTNYLLGPATGNQATLANLPTVTTPTATSIGSSTAILGANVTSNGGGMLLSRGTCWGPSAAPTTNCLAEGGTGIGIFAHSRTGITTNSHIYYRGYATNSAGTAYSSDGSFYTEPYVQASLVNFTLVTGTSMTVNWTPGTGGDGVIVLMKSASAIAGVPADGTFTTYNANPVFGSGSLITDGYVVYKGSNTSVAVTGLAGGTTYYVAVFEYKGAQDTSGDAQGTNYMLTPATGSQATITTPPTVTTNAATSIKSTSAILHGTVNANNSSTTVTFEYGLTTAYGTTVTADESPVTGAVATPVSFAIPGGLTPLTTYHFRVVGLNATAIPVYGLDATFSTAAVVAQTYYVNNTVTCNDSNPGTVPSAPFCTINQAAGIADAGDTVNVLAGTYAETVEPGFSGGPGYLITFNASPGVTVTGEPGNASNGGAFRLFGVGYIVIDGFTINGTADYGIYASYSNNLTISDNHVSYSGSVVNSRAGIYLSNTVNSTISGNTTDHNYNDGIRLKSNSNYNTVSSNISFGNAVTDASQATGINFLGSSYNTVVHNITYANEDSGLNFYDGSSYNQVIGNLTYGNGDHGIDNNGSPYNTVVGNTVHGNVTAGINFEESTEFGTNSSGAVISSNVCVDNGYLKLVGGGTLTGSNPGNIRIDTASWTGTSLDYDMVHNTTPGLVQIIFNGTPYYSMAEFKANNPSQEVNGSEANPLFKSPAPIGQRPAGAPYNVAVNLGDYHILATSPAIDSGNSSAPNPSTDLDGNPRVDVLTIANTGGGTYAYYDRGAYEYQPAAAQTITITSTAPSAAIFGGPTYTPTATATSDLPVAITVDAAASTVCSITGGVVSFIGVGSCVLDFNQAGNLLWSPAPQVQQTFAVGKANQTITVTTPAPASAAYNASFTVAATASSSLPVNYSATDVCTNLLGVFTMTSGTGTCTVHYNQAGDSNYNAAPEITAVVTATKIAQTISVGTHAPASAGYTSSFTVAATSSSTLAVTYSATGVCTNVLGVFTMTSNTGTCTVHYNQAGDANHNAALEVTEPVTATTGTQIITVTTAAPASAIYRTSFTVAATASSGLPVAYSATGACTNLQGVFTMTSGTGTCTVHYNQAGDANYAAAPEVTGAVTAAKAAQTITFTAPASPATYNTSFTIAPTSDSLLPVTVTPSGTCSILGTTVTMTSGTGICTLTASQSGDENYAPAVNVVQTVAAQKAAQAISIITHVPPSAAYLSEFTVSAISNSGLPVAYSATGVCTNIGATFTMTSAAGTCTVHFNQTGDANYTAATEVTEEVTARALAQTITVTTHAPGTAVFLTSFTVAATSSSGLPVTYSATGACTNVAGVFTMTSNFGICYVHYNQFGNSSYAAAPEIIEQVEQGTLFMYLPFIIR